MTWKDKIKDYCENYNIPLDYLSDTIREPKVVPMIRGKAFEFSAMLALQGILPKDVWEVKKTPMNAQQGSHDIDVEIIHKPTKKSLTVECKLSGKGQYKSNKDGSSEIRVKCMRSRTLGQKKVKELAPGLGISEDLLTVHNDQYLPRDFHLVLTSIGNSFYETSDTGEFVWQPKKSGVEFLKTIGVSANNIQSDTFNMMYVAISHDMINSRKNGIKCTRQKCTEKESCGFIPNYPIIHFNKASGIPNKPWVHISGIESLLQELIK